MKFMKLMLACNIVVDWKGEWFGWYLDKTSGVVTLQF